MGILYDSLFIMTEVRTTLLDIPSPYDNGLFALRDFKRGATVAIFATHDDGSYVLSMEEYSTLPDEQQMYGVDIGKNSILIPNTKGESGHLGLYANTFKHHNNTRISNDWWGKTKRVTLKATRNIRKGDEIYAVYGRGYKGMDAGLRPDRSTQDDERMKQEWDLAQVKLRSQNMSDDVRERRLAQRATRRKQMAAPDPGAKRRKVPAGAIGKKRRIIESEWSDPGDIDAFVSSAPPAAKRMQPGPPPPPPPVLPRKRAPPKRAAPEKRQKAPPKVARPEKRRRANREPRFARGHPEYVPKVIQKQVIINKVRKRAPTAKEAKQTVKHINLGWRTWERKQKEEMYKELSAMVRRRRKRAPGQHSWTDALQQWRTDNDIPDNGPWCIPKKGSVEYQEVKRIHEMIKASKQ
jgi:hypothetical protein